MKNVFVNSFNIISTLGNTALENYNNIRLGNSGVLEHNRPDISDNPVLASLISETQFDEITSNSKYGNRSRYEKLLIASIENAVNQSQFSPQAKKPFLFFLPQREIFHYLKRTNHQMLI
jgi:3-oxoacyl-[acyl-carrier-protein] synthase I